MSFFKAMKFSGNFLRKPVADWPSDEEYKAVEQVVESMSVVNDSAERGVKLAHDFLGSSRKEGNLQNILQVVENERKRLPKQRKRKVEDENGDKNWFLKLED